jgi:very-short-patch-repair endonuclease/predicted transcriptional regulator of viral defense system
MRGQRLERLAALAGKQHGVVAHRQLVALGFAEDAIQYQLATARLHRIHRGVYAVGHRKLTIRGHWMGAVLALGDNAVLSHLSAAALWGVLAIPGGAIDVLVETCGARRRKGIKVHETLHLPARDRTIRDSIPVTSLPRTLLDVAEVAPTRLRRAVDEADRLELLDVRAVRELCDRSHGRRGLKPLLALLDEATDAPNTKQEFEALFFDFCRAHRLPLPICNALVEGFEVDAFWPAHRLIVELDSWTFHRGRRAFERDRERSAALQAAGYRVIPVTWRRLTRHPAELAEQLRALMR